MSSQNGSAPPLRRAFDRVEEAVAGRIESAVNAPTGAYFLLAAAKVSQFGLRRVHEARSTVVHLWALPSHRDVRLLSAQVARLQSSVDELEQQLDELRPRSPAP